MKKFLAAALVVAATAAQAHPSIDYAVEQQYEANNLVQAAIHSDWCTDMGDSLSPQSHLARASLTEADAATYDWVNDSLLQAFELSPGTDSAVEEVLGEFCYASSER